MLCVIYLYCNTSRAGIVFYSFFMMHFPCQQLLLHMEYSITIDGFEGKTPE